jgi:hypothetical protein
VVMKVVRVVEWWRKVVMEFVREEELVRGGG